MNDAIFVDQSFSIEETVLDLAIVRCVKSILATETTAAKPAVLRVWSYTQ